MATEYVITVEWPQQSRPARRHPFDSMTAAYLFMLGEAASAIRSRRVFDANWPDDNTLHLTSPTGRVLETYTMSIEAKEKPNGTATFPS